MKKGYFITFEGGEACGKSTQINMLKKMIESSPYKDKFVFVRDPGQSPLGEEIRKIILFAKDIPNPITELFLYLASRVELCEKIIKPALNEGKIVISDRFYDSTIAYQGYARNILPIKEVLHLAKMSSIGLTPDLTFYLNLSPVEAFKRKGNSVLDRMELEGETFHLKVKNGYDNIAKKNKKRIINIDASKSPENIFEIITNIIKDKTKINL